MAFIEKSLRLTLRLLIRFDQINTLIKMFSQQFKLLFYYYAKALPFPKHCEGINLPAA
jgi:hypothetical protein